MIQAVVFDLGGVLFSEGKSVAIDKLCRECGYDRELLRKVLSSPESIDLRKGLISDETFWSLVRGQLPQSYDASLIKKEWYDGYVLDEDIFALIKELRGKYRLVAFSGNVRSRVDFLERKYHFRNLFDLEIYSFDYHHTKPEREFVKIMIEKVGSRPEEIVYIDDNDTYAQPARELGVQVLIYTRGEVARLRRESRERGVVL
ncbi:MAG TPA: HAD family hydrolase [Methylomirabilota bacterium]|nr:HAD family hydrolase [Methylomirabilota bacterium]